MNKTVSVHLFCTNYVNIVIIRNGDFNDYYDLTGFPRIKLLSLPNWAFEEIGRF